MLYECILMLLPKVVPQLCKFHKLHLGIATMTSSSHRTESYRLSPKHESIQNAIYFLYLNQNVEFGHSFELSWTYDSNEDRNIGID